MKSLPEIQLPLSEAMPVQRAIDNVTSAARALVANADVHEAIAQSLAVIREQVVALHVLLGAIETMRRTAAAQQTPSEELS